MSDAPLSERVRSGRFPVKGLPANSALVAHCLSKQVINDLADEIAALEERLRVSKAKREVEREAADDWQERYEAMKRIADAYHARLIVDDDECSADCICKE